MSVIFKSLPRNVTVTDCFLQVPSRIPDFEVGERKDKGKEFRGFHE